MQRLLLLKSIDNSTRQIITGAWKTGAGKGNKSKNNVFMW